MSFIQPNVIIPLSSDFAMNERIHLTSLRFEISPSTQDRIREQLQRFFQRDPSVTRIDATFEGEYDDNTRIIYHVTLRIQRQDEVIFELQKGPQLLPTVCAAADALERRLCERMAATTP